MTPLTAKASPSRSEVMRAVKSKGTHPEMVVRRLVHALGYRYRLHYKGLSGRPDLVFRGRGRVIFVNGCFWHGHKCRRGARMPATNVDYWKTKLARNEQRDVENVDALVNAGWKVLTIWECDTVPSKRDTLTEKLRGFFAD